MRGILIEYSIFGLRRPPIDGAQCGGRSASQWGVLWQNQSHTVLNRKVFISSKSVYMVRINNNRSLKTLFVDIFKMFLLTIYLSQSQSDVWWFRNQLGPNQKMLLTKHVTQTISLRNTKVLKVFYQAQVKHIKFRIKLGS